MLTIDILVDKHSEIADYFYSLPSVKTQKSTPICINEPSKRVKINEEQVKPSYSYKSRPDDVPPPFLNQLTQ